MLTHYGIFLIFLISYLSIAFRRVPGFPIGRTGGALFGAVAMVLMGQFAQFGPEQAYAAIDHSTLALLLGMMILTVFIERSGGFEQVASIAIRNSPTPFRLLIFLSIAAGVGSAFLVNDTICLFFTPIVVTICRRAQLPMGPYLIALASSANIGSAATLVGNPQNMIIGGMTRLSFIQFAGIAGPAAVIGLILNLALLWLFYRKQLDRPFVIDPVIESTPTFKKWPTILVTTGVIASFFFGAHLGFTALAGAVALLLYDRREASPVLARVDGQLLLFFACLFIVTAGLASTGIVESAWIAINPWIDFTTPSRLGVFAGLVIVGSNLVSNVPLVLLIGPHLAKFGDTPYILLAFISTIAGNLTLVGSVANLIVAEGAKEHYELGFYEYLKFGIPSTILVIAVGIPVILCLS